MSIFHDFVTALRLAFKAKFAWMAAGVLVMAALAMILSAYFGSRQPSTVALDVGFSTIRLLMPLLLVLLAQELLSREFDKRYFLNSLTYPHARHHFLLGRVAAIAALLLGLLVILAAVLAGLTAWIGQDYAQATPPDLGLPYIVTIAFIALDLLVVLAIGTLIAVATTTPSFVLIGTLGFMLVARSYSAIVALLTRDTTLVTNADSYQSSLSLLGYLLPDLGALDVRMISLYGQWQFLPEDWALRVLATLAYAAALLALAVWTLKRKRFA